MADADPLIFRFRHDHLMPSPERLQLAGDGGQSPVASTTSRERRRLSGRPKRRSLDHGGSVSLLNGAAVTEGEG
jgi:hypothetical protein